MYSKMTPDELVELTRIIDTYNYDYEQVITPGSLHGILWPSLNKLRQDPNRAALLEGWKYKDILQSVEYAHANGENSYIKIDDSEQRFIVAFWMSIYH